MILANLVFYPEYLSARTESTTIQIDFRLARMRAVSFRSLALNKKKKKKNSGYDNLEKILNTPSKRMWS